MSSAMLTALQGPVLRPALFLMATFNSGGTIETVYMWTGLGSITWNGQTWLGLGSLLEVSTAEEGATVEAKGIAFTLSGIDVASLANALQDFQVGLPVQIWLGLFDNSSPPSLIADPITTWAGKMDQPVLDVGGETASIAINCETRLIEMNCSVERRYTHDDTQLEHPGDLGCSFVNGLQEITVSWGHTPSSSANV
jgi:hypothetical protein